MLSKTNNDLLTQTDSGTPGGRLLRSYWQPIVTSEEMPIRGAPMPLKVMGEDLVLFRDDQDRLGLIGLHCAHRGTDLSYGRVENGGLRCLYLAGCSTSKAGASISRRNLPTRSSATRSVRRHIRCRRAVESSGPTWVRERHR
jgi:phthalate 4,5-dioxygenase